MTDPKSRILIVEDDAAIAAGLRLNLKHEGYLVSVEHDGEAGLKRALEEVPDLVVLDVMLPTMNGFEILRELRRRGFTSGVILLTAKGLEEDKVMGLDLGAEFIARIKAVLRRRQAQQPSLVVFADVTVDRRARTVTRGGQLVSLSPREMALLLYLIEHPGRAHSRDALLEGAWGLDYEGTERTVDNFVVSLRKKLEFDADDPLHFVTVRGVGYRFDPNPAKA